MVTEAPQTGLELGCATQDCVNLNKCLSVSNCKMGMGCINLENNTHISFMVMYTPSHGVNSYNAGK